MTKASLKDKLTVSNVEDTIPQLFDDILFGSTKSNAKPNGIQSIPYDKLVFYPNQRFRLYTKDALEALAEDIAINGVLSPAVVRQLDNGSYEILAGRNRTNAAKLAGLPDMPCIVVAADDNKAKLIVSSTNLNQRRDLLPSEEAYGYKMQLEALEQLGTNCPSVSKIADENNTNRKRIYRYLRLTELTDSLLNLVDDAAIPVMAGVNLSFCTAEDQQLLLEYLNHNKLRGISLKRSEMVRKLSEESNLTFDSLSSVLIKVRTAKPKAIHLPAAQLLPLIPVDVDVEEYIVTALTFYQERG